MPVPQQPQEIMDPFARAIPGQSFTDDPGSRPYEKPPMTSSPEQALTILEQSLKDEEFSGEIADILDVGVSCEAISEALVQKCFTEGMFSPDVAELIKPGVFMIVAQIGSDSNIDDIVLFNQNPESKRLSEESKVGLMAKLAPSKLRKIEEEANIENSEMYLYDEDYDPQQENMDEDMMLDSDEDDEVGFMDMEEPVIDQEEEEEIPDEEMEIQ
tara:strand:+ start:58 stop:699 length:642 start_codon:yes stop_codon:yes gene_type:complete